MLTNQTTGLMLNISKGHQLSVDFETIDDANFWGTNFRVLRSLGKGATSNVQLVEEINSGKKYAAKICNMEGQNSVVRLRIESEVYFMDQLRHPNVLSLERVLKIHQIYYVLMEWADKGDLFDYSRTKEGYILTEAEFMPLFRDILNALYHLHYNGVTHRDIKPQNIFLVSGNEVGNPPVAKLGDFGLATYIRESITSKCGTLAFVSPEVLNGNYNGPEADMWSLGVLAYFLLTGSLPFFSLNVSEFPTLISQGIFEFPSKPKLSKKMQTTISQLLLVDTKQRSTAKNVLLSSIFHEHIFKSICFHRVKQSLDFHIRRTSLEELLSGHNTKSLASRIRLGIPIHYVLISMKGHFYVLQYSMLNLPWSAVQAFVEKNLSERQVYFRTLIGHVESIDSIWKKPPRNEFISQKTSYLLVARDKKFLHLVEHLWNGFDAAALCTNNHRIMFCNFKFMNMTGQKYPFGSNLSKIMDDFHRIQFDWGDKKISEDQQELNDLVLIKNSHKVSVKWRPLRNLHSWRHIFLIQLQFSTLTATTLRETKTLQGAPKYSARLMSVEPLPTSSGSPINISSDVYGAKSLYSHAYSSSEERNASISNHLYRKQGSTYSIEGDFQPGEKKLGQFQGFIRRNGDLASSPSTPPPSSSSRDDCSLQTLFGSNNILESLMPHQRNRFARWVNADDLSEKSIELYAFLNNGKLSAPCYLLLKKLDHPDFDCSGLNEFAVEEIKSYYLLTVTKVILGEAKLRAFIDRMGNDSTDILYILVRRDFSFFHASGDASVLLQGGDTEVREYNESIHQNLSTHISNLEEVTAILNDSYLNGLQEYPQILVQLPPLVKSNQQRQLAFRPVFLTIYSIRLIGDSIYFLLALSSSSHLNPNSLLEK